MKPVLIQALTQLRHLAWKASGVLLILVPLSVSAVTLPDYYPEKFQKAGTIDRVDIRRGDIVINDSLKQLSMNARVHSLTTEFSSVQRLRAGMKIGYATTSINGKSQITEIWILSDNKQKKRE